MKRGASPGMVLVTVLWTMALLSALAIAASVTFRSFNGVVRVARDRVEVQGLMTAGLEAAAGIVRNAGGNPLSDTSRALSLASGSVFLTLADEGGRIDVGRAPADLLTGLFRAAGVPSPEAVAQSVVQWRKLNGGVDASSPPGTSAAGATQDGTAQQADPTSQPFADVADLALVPGIQPRWIAAVRPLATVFGHDTVNPLTAPEAVLTALPGVGRGQIEAFLEARRRASGDATRLLAMLGTAQVHLDPKPTQAVAVRLRATLADGFEAAAAATIVCLKDDSEPYRVLSFTPITASGSDS